MALNSWKPKTLQNQKHPKSHSKYQPKNGLLQNLNQLEEHSRYHHMTLKKMVCFKRQRARFCRGNRWDYKNELMNHSVLWYWVLYFDIFWGKARCFGSGLQGSYVTTSRGCNHTSYNEPAAGAAFSLQHVSRRPKGLMFWLVARITNRSYQFLEDESDDDYTDQWSYYCKPVIITRSMTVHITR